MNFEDQKLSLKYLELSENFIDLDNEVNNTVNGTIDYATLIPPFEIDLNELTYLNLTLNKLGKFPIIKNAPKLSKLDLKKNMIKNISGISNYELPELKWVGFAENGITELPEINANSLETLILNTNQLQYVSSTAFCGLKAIKVFIFNIVYYISLDHSS